MNAKRNICILIVAAMIVCTAAGADSYQADRIPWSGYWWPMNYGGLSTGIGYNGMPAPLSKYDYVKYGLFDGPATEYGNDRYYDPSAPHWFGLCHAWAVAATLEDEPRHKGIYKGIVFNVGDKKGLLTAIYDGATFSRSYFDGADGPKNFHFILESIIGEQRRSFVVDIATNDQVWNHPVYRYETSYSQAGNVRHYTTTIHYVGDMVAPDYVGSQTSKQTYYYYFVMSGDTVTDSGWEGPSVNNHPSKGDDPYGTRNYPGLDIDLVRNIAETVDDAYRGNSSKESAAVITSGAYQLLAIGGDYFAVAMQKGDRLKATIADSSDGGVILRSYDPFGAPVAETVGDGDQGFTAAHAGTYILEIVPRRVGWEPEYRLYLSHILSYRAVLPFYPSGSSWSTGVAVLSPDGSLDRTFITAVASDGTPQSGIVRDLRVRQITGGLEGNFGLAHALNGYAWVDADNPFTGMQVATNGGDLFLGCNLIPKERAAPELFFPHNARTNGWKTYYCIINVGDDSEEIVRTAYNSAGMERGSDVVTLGPGEKTEFLTTAVAALSADSASMSARASSGRSCLVGYIRFDYPPQSALSSSKAADLATLPLDGTTELLAPLVACSGGWFTGFVVMNSGSGQTTARFYAYAEDGSLLGTVDRALPSKGNMVFLPSSLFPDIDQADIASLRILSLEGQPLSGLSLYAVVDEGRLAVAPLKAAGRTPLVLSHLASDGLWQTGIALMNASDGEREFRCTLHDRDGAVLDEAALHLGVNERRTATLKDLFGEDIQSTARFVAVETADGEEAAVAALYIMTTNLGDSPAWLMGDAIETTPAP